MARSTTLACSLAAATLTADKSPAAALSPSVVMLLRSQDAPGGDRFVADTRVPSAVMTSSHVREARSQSMS